MLNNKLTDALSFVRAFVKNPREVGSVIPSSKNLAKRIRHAVDEQDQSIILVEAGSGTGSITQEIYDLNPVVVEFNPELCKLIKKKFPLLEVKQQDIKLYLKSLTSPVGMVFTIPLKNNPEKDNILAAIQEQYDKGNLKWCVLYTYGRSDPLKGLKFSHTKKYSLSVANVPPAYVWAYK